MGGLDVGWVKKKKKKSQICSLENFPFLMGKRGKRHGNCLQRLQKMDFVTIHKTFTGSGGNSRRAGFGLI